MDNINKIFECNNNGTYKTKISNGAIIFECNDTEFSGITIGKIINFVNTVHTKYRNLKIPLIFSFKNVLLADKLSYILFECICYSLIKNYNHLVYLYWNPQKDILTEGVFSSPLKLLNEGNIESIKKYPEKFKMDIFLNHFRRVIDGKNKETTNYLGNLLQELDSFLKYFCITQEYRDQITEVITELVGNACEHGCTDCLLDIDITNDHLKEVSNVQQEGTYYGINIAIVNFSDILLHTGIKEKISKEELMTGRYLELKKAYEFHKKHFTDNYKYEDFCNIATLQDKISGRFQHNLSGGTGLTKLIQSLQEKSDSNACYVISGNRSIYFHKELLNYDENGWIGFNESNDFFKTPPEDRVISGCYIFFPGTAYNLNFIMKREDN